MIIGPRVARSIAYSLACVLTMAAICLPLSPSCLAQGNDQLPIRNATIDGRFDFTPSDRLRKLMMDRIKLSAKAVAAYSYLSIFVGVDSTEPDFAEDWITTHGMVHLAFPSVAEPHHWIEEGLATYVEPIARARIGEPSRQKVWGDMVDGVPNGLPQPVLVQT